MRRRIRQIVILSLLGTGDWGVDAHPTSYQGATSLMSFNTENRQTLWAHYSLVHWFSVGAKFLRMKQFDGEDAYSGLSHLGVLVHRWNHKDFQANLYIHGGVGGLRTHNRNGLAGLAAVEADIENRQFYFASEYQALIAKHLGDAHSVMGRVGFAPYLADFEDLHSWIVLQYDFEKDAANEHSVTPLARMFYRNFLWEFGASIRGEWMLNFMIHF